MSAPLVSVVTALIPGPPGPIAANVTTLSSLAPLPISAVTWPAGTLIAYTPVADGPSNYYQWAPGSSATPDGISIVSGNGGNWLLLGGGGALTYAIKTASYQLQPTDTGADFEVSSGTGPLTCSMASGMLPGRGYFVSVGGSASSANSVTVTPPAGYTILGQSSYVLDAPYQSATFVLPQSGTDFRVM